MKNKMAASHGSQSPPSIGRPVDRVFEDAQFTGEIILHGRKLREYPPICTKFDLNDTIHVDVSRNRLNDLPAEICDYHYAERVNCYHNVIRSIPDAIAQLQALTHLNLSRNQLTVLSPALCVLRSLEVLSASNNKLVSLPEEIGQLEHLMDLDVSCNEISHLPLQIGDLSSLRNLNLRRNYLVELPLEISRLHLYRLDFSSNRIEKIPTVFRKMETLQQLIHDNNPLSSPPAYICTKGKQHIMKYLQIEATKEDRKRGIMVNNDSDIKRYVRKSLPPQQPSEDFRNMLGASESKWKRHTVLSNDSGYSTGDGEKNGWASGESSMPSGMTSDSMANNRHYSREGHFSFPNNSSAHPAPAHPYPYHQTQNGQSGRNLHDHHHQQQQYHHSRQSSDTSTDSLPPPPPPFQTGPLMRLPETSSVSHRHQSSSSSSSTLSPGPHDYDRDSFSPTSPQPQRVSPYPQQPNNSSQYNHQHHQYPPPPPPPSSHFQSNTPPSQPSTGYPPRMSRTHSNSSLGKTTLAAPVDPYTSGEPPARVYSPSSNPSSSSSSSSFSPSSYQSNTSTNTSTLSGQGQWSSRGSSSSSSGVRNNTGSVMATTGSHSRQHSNSLVDYSKPRSDSPSLSAHYYYDNNRSSVSSSSSSDHLLSVIPPATVRHPSSNVYNPGHLTSPQQAPPPPHGHPNFPQQALPPQWPRESRAQLLKAPSSSSAANSPSPSPSPPESAVSPPLPPHIPLHHPSSSTEERRAPIYQMEEDLDFQDDPPVVMTGNMEDEFTRELKRQKADYEKRKKQAEEIRLKQQVEEEEQREKEERRLAAIKLQEEQKWQREEELRRQEEEAAAVAARKAEEARRLKAKREEEEEAQRREEELKRLKESALIQEAKEREKQRAAEEELRKVAESKVADEARKNKLSNNYHTQINQHPSYANARGLPPKPPTSLPVHGMTSQIPVSQRESPHVDKDYIMSESEYRNALSSQSFKEQRRLTNSTQYRRAASDSLKKPSPNSQQVETLNHINRNGVAEGSRLSSASTTPSVSPSPSPSSSISHLAKPTSSTGGGHHSLLAKPGSSSASSSTTNSPSGSHSHLAKPSGASSGKVGGGGGTKSGVPRANGSGASSSSSAASQAVRRTKMAGDRSNTSSPVTARSTRTAGTTGLRSQTGGIPAGSGPHLRRSSNSSTTDDETKGSKLPNSSAPPSRLKSRLEEQKQRGAGHPPTARKLATPDNDNKRINIKPPANSYGSNRTRAGVHGKSGDDAGPNHRRKEELQREEAEQMDRLRQTVESRLKVTLPDNLAEALRDGVVLCHLANQIRPRSVGSIHVPSPAVPKLTLAKCRRNVDNFLEACRKIGVGAEQICGAGDIFEEKGISRVALTVAALVAIGTNPKQSAV